MKAWVSIGGETADAGLRPIHGRLVAAIALAAWAASTPFLVNSARQSPADPGELVYQEFCSACHGPSGRGGEMGATLLSALAARRSPREQTLLVTVGVVDRGMPGFGRGLSAPEIDAVVNYVRKLQGNAIRGGALTSERVAASVAERSESIQRGEALFGGKAACLDCHSVATFGGRVGPDLSRVAGRLDPSGIFESLAFPSNAIVEAFAARSVVTREGRIIRGRFRRETPDTIQLLDATGNLWTTYFKKDLESVGSKEESVMPANLLKRLMPDETKDLLAYLNSLK